MRKTMSFGIAALVTLAAVVIWSNATSRSGDRAAAFAASGSPINPLELMKGSKHLPHQQYEAY